MGDNKFNSCCKCPARMQDARIFTNYLPKRSTDEYIRIANNLPQDDNHAYRICLQKNAEKIIEAQQKHVSDTLKCTFWPKQNSSGKTL
ncbi:MAG: hypothetical protein Faunusvirus59_2 [Faunusvirus sp.]|jgi:hypothetical protein|uniref:Uncharacterized protein n=1 Tax=Faunusvirus sp. TaxID=2487766 RepID=A0A3G4ZY32_9VIRU|nr:MAG: hypothetical protein Faunusvirus59_2 [Faunusvirus sp.]